MSHACTAAELTLCILLTLPLFLWGCSQLALSKTSPDSASAKEQMAWQGGIHSLHADATLRVRAEVAHKPTAQYDADIGPVSARLRQRLS